MLRTALLLFAITVFVAWYVHAVNRAASGAGFHRERLASDVAFTATVTAALYVLLVTWALVGVYVRHVRGLGVGILGVLLLPFVWWTVSAILALFVGVVLAEVYCLVDEYFFERESRRSMATASPDTSREQHHSRARWWPASNQRHERGNR
ncbi:MAG: hypothetical protein ABIP93_21735 [Gemmatimonadaceae bacterium]